MRSGPLPGSMIPRAFGTTQHAAAERAPAIA
jgi:hypothetical protein